MTEQIRAARNKARKGLYALRLASKYVNRNSLKMMADGLVSSHLGYCDTVLAQAAPTNLKKLQSCQDRAIRIIFRAPRDADCDMLREKLGWLDLFGKRNVHMATLIWRSLNGQAPPAIAKVHVNFEAASN